MNWAALVYNVVQQTEYINKQIGFLPILGELIILVPKAISQVAKKTANINGSAAATGVIKATANCRTRTALKGHWQQGLKLKSYQGEYVTVEITSKSKSFLKQKLSVLNMIASLITSLLPTLLENRSSKSESAIIKDIVTQL